MGNKDKARHEEKKKPQPKPKPAPGRKRDDFSQSTARIANAGTEKN